MPPKPAPADVLRLMALCKAHFAGPSWSTWRVVLKALFALPMTEADLATYRELTGRTEAPMEPARELWCVVGRRAGKSIVAALIAVFLSTCRTYRLAPGERGVLMVIASDRRQARVVRRYIGGILASVPALAALVAREVRETIDLTNGISIEIHTASFRTTRGYTVVGVVGDEIAFWRTEDAAEPDREILAALRPAMATTGGLLVCLSSPYARRGELFRAHRDHYGKDGDPVLVVQGATQKFNPIVPSDVIERAYEDDATSAAAEWGGFFRSDVESYVSREAAEACVVPDRHELPPTPGLRYSAFVDPSGGSRDSFTLAIGHAAKSDAGSVAVIDAARERKAPFSPEEVVAEYAALLRRYNVLTVVGDRYAGEWPREAFRRHGIAYEIADRPKSDLYRDALGLLNSGRVELPDSDRLLGQIVGLERRTARGGRDSIDHAPGGTDDLANAVLGLAVTLAVKPERIFSTAPCAHLIGI